MVDLNIDKSNWQLISFGDVAIQKKGRVDRDSTTLTRYVKGEHMGSEDIHLREWGELDDEYLGPAFHRRFDEGNILYGSRRTYLKKVCIAPFAGITSNTTFVVEANEEFLDKRLLPFIMLSEGFTKHSIQHSKGSVNPYINWKDLANYEFLLPPKDQQAEIAELLWALDQVIESNQAILSRLHTLKVCELKNRIKSEAELTPIEEVGTVNTGRTPPTKDSVNWDMGTIPFITPGDINQGDLILDDTQRHVTEIGLEHSRKVSNTDVLVVCIGATIGKVCVPSTASAYNQQINSISVTSELEAIALGEVIKLNQHLIKRRVGNAPVPILSKSAFQEIKIPWFDRFEEFAEKSLDFIMLTEQANTSIEKSKVLLISLIQRLLDDVQ
jgi:restriction endonuclease S subunit